jgi:hypothetical protein
MSRKEDDAKGCTTGPPVMSAVPLAEIKGDDDEDTSLLKEMAVQAVRYIRSRKWCLDLKETYYADGIGGIVAVFLFRVAIEGSDGYQWMWVFEGDVPSAYMEVSGRYTNPHAALTRYIDGLQAWVEAAERGESLRDLMPIEVPPTPEYVGMLRSRIATLRESILPNFRSG